MPVQIKNRFVDCSKNPIDLRPAVKAIMSSVNSILSKLPDDVPLIIIMGEQHNLPTNITLQKALIQAINEKHQEQLAVGVERPKKLLNKVTKLHRLQNFLRGLIGYPKKAPEDYLSTKALKKAKKITKHYREAAISNQHLLEHLFASKTPVSSNDLPYKQYFFSIKKFLWRSNGFLSKRDKQTKSILKRWGIPHPFYKRISSVETDGMLARNIAMVENALEHLNETRAKIYIQTCGVGHAEGFGDFYPYSESLTALFESTGCATLIVNPTFDILDPDLVPEDYPAQTTNRVSIKGLSDRAFLHWKKRAERKFIDEIDGNSGGILNNQTSRSASFDA